MLILDKIPYLFKIPELYQILLKSFGVTDKNFLTIDSLKQFDDFYMEVMKMIKPFFLKSIFQKLRFLGIFKRFFR